MHSTPGSSVHASGLGSRVLDADLAYVLQQAHFQHVWVCEMKEDVNKLVIGSQSDLRSRAQADSLATEHHQLVQAPDMPEQQEAV